MSRCIPALLFCIALTLACTKTPPVPSEILQAEAAEAAGKPEEARRILEAAEAAHLESPAFSYELALLSARHFDDFFKGEIRTIIVEDTNYRVFGRATKMSDIEGRELGFMLRDLSPVIEILDRALARDRKHTGAWLQKANCLAEMNRIPEALDLLSNAREYLPRDARIPYFMGTLHLHEERYAEAERAFREARGKDSRDSAAALYHGLCLLALGEGREAEKALARTIDLAKDANLKDAERALYDMFTWYYDRGLYEEAYTWGEKHLSLVKNTEKLFRALAISAFISEHYDDANKWLGESIQKSGEDALVLALYGQLHVSDEKYAEAEELFKRSLKLQETVQVLAQLGSIYLEKLGSPAQAIVMLERAIALQPEHCRARFQLAKAYRAGGYGAAAELAAWNAYLSIAQLGGEDEKEYMDEALARVQELGAAPAQQ